MLYLKEEQHYIDRYDLGTIEECLKWYLNIKYGFEEHRKDKDFEKYTKEKFNTEVHKITSFIFCKKYNDFFLGYSFAPAGTCLKSKKNHSRAFNR